MYREHHAGTSMINEPLNLTVFRCQGCGALHERAPVVCATCLGQLFDEQSVAGLGTLASWTTIRKPPLAFRGHGAYDVAVVDLDAGLRVTGRIASQDGQAVGDVVRITHQILVGDEQISVFEVEGS